MIHSIHSTTLEKESGCIGSLDSISMLSIRLFEKWIDPKIKHFMYILLIQSDYFSQYR